MNTLKIHLPPDGNQYLAACESILAEMRPGTSEARFIRSMGDAIYRAPGNIPAKAKLSGSRFTPRSTALRSAQAPPARSRKPRCFR